MRKPKSPGGQPQNLNALKHGFYSRVLTESEKLELDEARAAEGLDDEIALIRFKICKLLERDPDNLDLILQASNTLARLIRIKFQLTPEQGKGLKAAFGNVLREIAIPLGIKVGETLITKKL